MSTGKLGHKWTLKNSWPNDKGCSWSASVFVNVLWHVIEISQCFTTSWWVGPAFFQTVITSFQLQFSNLKVHQSAAIPTSCFSLLSQCWVCFSMNIVDLVNVWGCHMWMCDFCRIMANRLTQLLTSVCLSKHFSKDTACLLNSKISFTRKGSLMICERQTRVFF